MALKSTGVGGESVGGGGEGWQGRGGGVRRGERGGTGQVLRRVEVTMVSQKVWRGEGCRTAGGTECGGWETRWEYWTGPWGRECAGRLSVSHEKKRKSLKDDGNSA